MKNLHLNNIFVSKTQSSEVLVTDVGLAEMPGYQPKLEIQSQFLAPELAYDDGCTGEDTV